jgi:lathosterol oxidase
MIYLCMFVIVNFWTVSIHDGVNVVPGSFVNGTAHHTEHHARFEVNYGQFFTVWDRMFGTYWLPGSETGDVNEVIKPAARVKKSN